MTTLPAPFVNNFFALAPLMVERIETALKEDGLQQARWMANFQSLVEGARDPNCAYVALFSHSIAEAGRTRAGCLVEQVWIAAMADAEYSDTRTNAPVNLEIGAMLAKLHAVLAFWKPAGEGFEGSGLIPESPPTLLDPLPGYAIYPLTFRIAFRLFNEQTNRPSTLLRASA